MVSVAIQRAKGHEGHELHLPFVPPAPVVTSADLGTGGYPAGNGYADLDSQSANPRDIHEDVLRRPPTACRPPIERPKGALAGAAFVPELGRGAILPCVPSPARQQ